MRFIGLAFAAALLAFSGFMGGGEAQAEEEADAVFIGRVTGMFPLDTPACPPEYVCLSSVYLIGMDKRQHVSGPVVADDATIVMTSHSQFMRDVVLRVRAQPIGENCWQVVERQILGYDFREQPVPVEVVGALDTNNGRDDR